MPETAALGWDAYYTLGALVLMTAALVKGVARADLVLMGTLGLLLVAGVVAPMEAFVGFSNPAVITIGALFVVAAGVERTRALAFLDRLVRPGKAGVGGILSRVMTLTMGLSGVLNNTPVVAMLIPKVQEWARRNGLPPTQLLIPLSYAAILGGMLTLVGTSTNIIVHGLLLAEGLPGYQMFELAWIGLPASVVAVLYFAAVGWRTLPARQGGEERLREQLRAYHFDVRVTGDAPFAGDSVEEAGLRTLRDAYLVHLRRGDRVIPASPEEPVEAGDVLTFVGDVRVLDQLLARPGFERKVSAIEEPDRLRPVTDFVLYEAVVAASSQLVGRTLKEVGFREEYGGVVLAVNRRGARIDGSLGRTPLKAGDLLLIEAGPGFGNRYRSDREDFYVVVPIDEVPQRASRRAPVALALLVGMVTVAALKVLPLVVAAFAAALGMVLTGCLSGTRARQSIDLSILLVIAAAFGIGSAVEATGLAAVLAHGIAGVAAGADPIVALILLYVATNLLTELVSNQAAAVLMFPVALGLAADLGLDPKGTVVVINIAAAARFLTPIGYQTNLMVMGPGGYRYTDFTKAGLPLSLLVLAITITMVSVVWMG